MVVQKTPQEIELMARAGEILAAVHEVLREAVQPGMTTADLDAVAAEEIAERGRPGFLGTYDYPAASSGCWPRRLPQGPEPSAG
jgi:methionyl aminopeptidase